MRAPIEEAASVLAHYDIEDTDWERLRPLIRDEAEPVAKYPLLARWLKLDRVDVRVDMTLLSDGRRAVLTITGADRRQIEHYVEVLIDTGAWQIDSITELKP